MASLAHEQDIEAVQRLWTLLAAISGPSEEIERARLITTGLPSLVPCTVSGLILLHEAGRTERLLHKDGESLDSVQTETIFADLEPLVQEAFRGAPLLLAAAVGEIETGRIPPSLEKLGVRTMALVPLMTVHSRMGALVVGREDGASFSKHEQVVLLALAEHAGIGIENLRLAEKQQQQAERLQDLVNERTRELRQSQERHRVLLDINNAIIAHFDKGSLFAAIVQALRQVIFFDRAMITLLDSKRDRLQVFALASSAEEREVLTVGTELPRQDHPFANVLSEKCHFIRRDLANEYRTGHEEAIFQVGIRSYIGVPLVRKLEAFGVLSIGSRTPNRYSEADAEFLTAIGHQVALAIDNTLAYEEIAHLKARLEQENVYLQEEIRTEIGYTALVGQSPALRNVLRQVDMVAPTDASVIILGESGTGKELIAREIHNRSRRRDKPLIRANCASIPRELYESEFFGHVKGAFTGAIRDRAGRFELADGGTLFLDEVGEIPLELQSKLLRVLQEQQYERVGDEQTRQVDVRVIAATNRDLKQDVERRRFRQDLYYRLNVFPIEVAPLRRRKEDIPLLAEHFLALASKKLNCPQPRLTQAHVINLQGYDWPGNVRELHNVIERAVITSRGGSLHLDLPVTEIPVECPPSVVARTAGEGEVVPDIEMQRRERENLLSALQQSKWKIYGAGGAAELLGIKPTTLLSRMRKMGLKKPT
ncbi:MAG: sigma 54-interacting transcriptional regulator [Nitrospiraceae bacterium]|nr:sigma 54-interacting transcriptional regulator [Nitrospiraceae bacterium]